MTETNIAGGSFTNSGLKRQAAFIGCMPCHLVICIVADDGMSTYSDMTVSVCGQKVQNHITQGPQTLSGPLQLGDNICCRIVMDFGALASLVAPLEPILALKCRRGKS